MVAVAANERLHPSFIRVGEGGGTGRLYCKIMHGVNACFSPFSLSVIVLFSFFAWKFRWY